jgi:uncharacterized membrane protein YhdT
MKARLLTLTFLLVILAWLVLSYLPHLSQGWQISFGEGWTPLLWVSMGLTALAFIAIQLWLTRASARFKSTHRRVMQQMAVSTPLVDQGEQDAAATDSGDDSGQRNIIRIVPWQEIGWTALPVLFSVALFVASFVLLYGNY